MDEPLHTDDVVAQVQDALERAEGATDDARLATLDEIHERLETELDQTGSPGP